MKWKKHILVKGQGCSECSFNSKGEEYIKMYLEEFEIKYIRQHSFDTCRYINRLSFDFYLPELNTCVEFDGEQHFKPNKFFGGKSGFNETIKRDKCKNKWCDENQVELIRIRYDQIDKIKSILIDKLEKNNIKN
jgi:very-short-patch-repair endonuclease